MKYTEIKGDLFRVDSKYYLCHCISADFKLGLGIALEFDNRYKMRAKLNRLYMVNATYPKALLVDNVFNLVTKALYWHKPTYLTLRGSLEDMKAQIVASNIRYLAMPQIGCKLDKLQWGEVSRIIQEVFSDIDIEILVVIRDAKLVG